MSGLVPVLLDPSTGELLMESGEVGRFGGPRSQRRWSRRSQKHAAKQAYYDSLRGDDDDDADDYMPPARSNLVDSYRLAGAANLIQENQIDGLGFTAIVASGTGTLTDTLNRQFWAKSVILESDDPSSIVVTAIAVAGIPVNVGSQGTPLSLWSRDSTRFSQVIGRRSISVGQQFRVSLQNIDAGSGHTVSGGLVGDELQMGVAQQAMEKVMIDAALALVDVGRRQ